MARYRIGFPFMLWAVGAIMAFMMMPPFGYTVAGCITGAVAFALPITLVFGLVFWFRSRGKANIYRYSLKYAAFYMVWMFVMTFGKHVNNT